jgi:hypothetical protein
MSEILEKGEINSDCLIDEEITITKNNSTGESEVELKEKTLIK